MSGFLQEISKATRAMDVYRKATEVLGNNISHASNPDYAKQIANIKSLGSFKSGAGLSSGLGIDITTIDHLRNENLDKKIVREASAAGSLTGQHLFAKSVEIYFQSEATGLMDKVEDSPKASVTRSLDSLLNAFHGFAASPSEPSKKTIVVSDAQLLVNQVNTLNQNLENVDSDIVAETQSAVTKVNGILENISKLNEKIARFEVNSQQKALEDRDLRQAAFEQLSEYINFETEIAPNTKGVLNVVVKDSSNNNVVLVDRDTVINEIQFDGTNIATDGPASVVIDLTGGRLHGYLKVRAGFLADTRSALNDFTQQVVASINLAYNPTGTTGNFFDASGVTASTFSLDSTLSETTLKASDTGNSGANEIALEVAALSKKSFSTTTGDLINGTFIENFTEQTVAVGQEVSILEYKMEAQSDVERAYKRIRDDLGGVSLDEEVTETMKMQRVIQGLAYYTKTIDKMLEYIIEKLG